MNIDNLYFLWKHSFKINHIYSISEHLCVFARLSCVFCIKSDHTGQFFRLVIDLDMNVFVCSRLLEELIEKEREYQAILQQVLDEREQEIKLLKCRSGPVGESDLRIYTHTHTLMDTHSIQSDRLQ